jgi:hypothetical protein
MYARLHLVAKIYLRYVLGSSIPHSLDVEGCTGFWSCFAEVGHIAMRPATVTITP